jgi:hypothetical protein
LSVLNGFNLAGSNRLRTRWRQGYRWMVILKNQ